VALPLHLRPVLPLPAPGDPTAVLPEASLRPELVPPAENHRQVPPLRGGLPGERPRHDPPVHGGVVDLGPLSHHAIQEEPADDGLVQCLSSASDTADG
jgi:hypothetical protein